MDKILKPVKIVSNKKVAKDVYILSFKREFDFRAGQIIAIDLVANGTPRLYSIASGEGDEYVEILFDEKTDGKLTPHLSNVVEGDVIYVSEPFGNFQCTHKDCWFIAAGTGIAPFVSMLRSGMAKGKKIIHGGKLDENFYFSDLIETELASDYVRCASQQADTLFYKGRLTKWLEEQPVFSKGISYYLCGSSEMVVDVRDFLIKKGVSFDKIISETYF